ncbi:MAG: AbrB/MazE/SpoVT family DNA-binding domain-containing protein [Ruminiclostridium sp.]
MSTTVMKGRVPMDRKKVSISSKRQITIPQKFFSMLGFDTEAECILRGNELVIRPVKTDSSGEFDEFILADLISQGYTGNELLEAFKAERKKIRPAVEKMLEEAERVARGEGEYYTYDDIFGAEDEE